MKLPIQQLAEGGLCARLNVYQQRQLRIAPQSIQRKVPERVVQPVQTPKIDKLTKAARLPKVLAAKKPKREPFTLDPQTISQISERPSVNEIMKSLDRNVSRITVSRALRRLVDEGLLPLHPRDPRTKDESGVTLQTRNFDQLVHRLLQENNKLRIRELVELLADPARLGVTLSWLTVQRSRARLIAAGQVEGRFLPHAEYKELDDQVEALLTQGRNYHQIVKELAQPLNRIKASAARLRKLGKVESQTLSSSVMVERVKNYLKEHRDEKVNLSAIARSLGVSREYIRQIYSKLNQTS